MTEGIRVTSLVVARGAVEVRAHLVVGAAPGTPVRVTGWSAPAGDGLHAEITSVHGPLTTTDSVATLFVSLARLTGEPDPRPSRSWCP